MCFRYLVACVLSPVKGIEGGLPVFWHVDIDAAYMRCCLHINVKYEKLSVGFTVFHSHTSISCAEGVVRACDGCVVIHTRVNYRSHLKGQHIERKCVS